MITLNESDIHLKWSFICGLRRAELMDDLAMLNLPTCGGMGELRQRLLFCKRYNIVDKTKRVPRCTVEGLKTEFEHVL